MQLLIYGPGRLGRAIAAAAVDAGWPEPDPRRPAGCGRPSPVRPRRRRGRRVRRRGRRRQRRPRPGRRQPGVRPGDVGLGRGHRPRPLDPRRPRRVRGRRPNLSIGAALFLRLAETAAGWYARAGSFEPSIVEWHRRGKADRPSGTARALARRIVAVDPRWSVEGDLSDADRPALEVAGIRAGAAPGTHLVTFDGTGESIELRLAARDRSAYADGALAAARWLRREPRTAGLHAFDEVVDDLLAPSPIAVPA